MSAIAFAHVMTVGLAVFTIGFMWLTADIVHTMTEQLRAAKA